MTARVSDNFKMTAIMALAVSACLLASSVLFTACVGSSVQSAAGKEAEVAEAVPVTAPAAKTETPDGIIEKTVFVQTFENPGIIEFEGKQGQVLEAEIISPETGNIRINNIIGPDNEGDGPFGRQISYKLNKSGLWQMIINGSMMQGDSYTGNVTVRYSVK